ncbi:hypothetical protein As57867_004525, partial [Aphanomyces stellatus]
LKLRLVNTIVTCASKRDTVPHEGGSLYHLYDQNPRYKKVPLLSHRGADCFVDCYDVTGCHVKRIRLSLLHCLDLQLHDPKWALHTCVACPRARAVCTIETSPNCTAKEGLPGSRTWLHKGANYCQWVK